MPTTLLLNLTASTSAVSLVPDGEAAVGIQITWRRLTTGGGDEIITPPGPGGDTGTTTGKITFYAIGLPQGVTATFSPPSLTVTAGDSGETLLVLHAAVSAPETSAPIAISVATTGAFSASTYATLSVGVSRLLILPVGVSGVTEESTSEAVSLAAFGNATIPVLLQVASGVTGTISLAVTTTLPFGISSQFEPSSFTAPANGGGLSGNLVLTASGNIAPPGTTSVSFAAEVNSATRAAYTFPLTLLAPYVSNILPSPVQVPMFGQPGTLATITGGGFGPSSTVAFGPVLAVPAESVASDGTSLTAVVPATATTGPLTVSSPAGLTSGTPHVAVNRYRNTRGFVAFNNDIQNAVGGSFTLADATALFGSGQTESTIVVTFENPFCAVFLFIADAVLDSGGQCFGMALSSLRFIAGQQSYVGQFPLLPAVDLEPGGPPGPDVWQLAGPVQVPSTTLPSYIHVQHLAQFSVESIGNYLNIHNPFNSWSAANLRTAVQTALVSGFAPIIAVNPSIGTGHALIAFEIVDGDNGDFDLLVYNCNVPFDIQEDLDSETNLANGANSVIHVTSVGTWTLQPFSPPDTTVWTGGMAGITPIPWGTIPIQPTAPFSIAEIATLAAYVLWAVYGAATATQVSDGLGHTLLSNGEWNRDPDTTLAGVAPMPNFGGLGKVTPTAFVGNTTQPLIHTVTGSGSAYYDFNWVGSSHALMLTNMPITFGASDTVSTDSAARKIGLTPSSTKAVTATVIGVGAASKLPRTATLKTTASVGAAVTLSFTEVAETFTYVHEGVAASFTIELSSRDANGAPVSFTTAPAQVATGDTMTFQANWDQLATGAGNVQITSANGTVVNSPLK